MIRFEVFVGVNLLVLLDGIHDILLLLIKLRLDVAPSDDWRGELRNLVGRLERVWLEGHSPIQVIDLLHSRQAKLGRHRALTPARGMTVLLDRGGVPL